MIATCTQFVPHKHFKMVNVGLVADLVSDNRTQQRTLTVGF